MIEAGQLFDELGRVGVDYADLVRTLEREGVRKFAHSFAELLEGVHAKSDLLPATT